MQRCKWEDNIEMNLREMGSEEVDRISGLGHAVAFYGNA
jgi:hypothetical protein